MTSPHPTHRPLRAVPPLDADPAASHAPDAPDTGDAAPHPGCTEGRLLTDRRSLLRGAVLGGTSVMVGGASITYAGGAAAAGPVTPQPRPASSVIVVVSLRGAADGLSMVVPHADAAYYAGRPTTAVPRAALLAADAQFGLHPAMSPLMPLWQSGRLAAIHATGLPVANRSHFAAMEELEDAAPGSAERSGWLNRLVGANGDQATVEALAVGSGIPTLLAGPSTVMSFGELDRAELAGGDARDRRSPRRRALNALWGKGGSEMGAGVRTALTSLVDLAPAQQVRTGRRRGYTGGVGEALADVARVLKADIGVAAVTVDTGSWDMHVGMGTVAGGWMVDNVTELASSVGAFFADLGPVAEKVTLVTVTEFGRRVQENGSRGTDHGWGSVMLVAGAGVKGGYYGRWPGLENSLDADVPVTTDYRDVLAEVVSARTGASTAAVFPGHQWTRTGFMTSAGAARSAA
ncbi:DUF1501 domain-containing protein [Nocardioides bruguierae]|uniref:DUF1501 domain-containing protein n=1 Tax=Nocardioides bruguierae TaxID=2945102 RepID=UPI00201FC72E|nr:DUF1501 domain-containing protein [Nocardioides bruguierae]MCL8026644.1 DUF1501 domain-containing protein [Nocardioides bruguierae]